MKDRQWQQPSAGLQTQEMMLVCAACEHTCAFVSLCVKWLILGNCLSLSLVVDEWPGVRIWLRSGRVLRLYNVFTTQTDNYTAAYYWPSKPPRCTVSYRNSREADRQWLETRQPAQQLLDVEVLSAEIKINAGNRISVIENGSKVYEE